MTSEGLYQNVIRLAWRGVGGLDFVLRNFFPIINFGRAMSWQSLK